MSLRSGNLRPLPVGRSGPPRTAFALLALAVAGAVWLGILQCRIGEIANEIRPEAKGIGNLYSVSEWEAKLAAADANATRVRRSNDDAVGTATAQPGAPLSVFKFRTKAGVILGPSIERQYAPLLAVLHLGTEQEAQLLAILAGKRIGVCPNIPLVTGLATPAALHRFVSDVDNEVRDLIGSRAYEAYRQFLQTLPARNLAADLQNGVAASGNALSNRQMAQLLSLFERSVPAANDGAVTTPYPNSRAAAMGTSETLVTDAMLLEAARVLNRGQFEQLKAIQRMQTSQLALDQAEAAAYAAKLTGPKIEAR